MIINYSQVATQVSGPYIVPFVNIDNVFLNGVVFIYLKKAFDTIDHEIILRKMSFFGADQAANDFLSIITKQSDPKK